MGSRQCSMGVKTGEVHARHPVLRLVLSWLYYGHVSVVTIFQCVCSPSQLGLSAWLCSGHAGEAAHRVLCCVVLCWEALTLSCMPLMTPACSCSFSTSVSSMT